MSYQTYTTEALVCGTWNKNTSDKSYLLFTKDAGMLYADARSVREEKSKQRYSLQDFSHVKISLVKGKAGWKIGSVESQCNHYAVAYDKAARGSVVNVYRFVRRFYKGEEAWPDLFLYLKDTLNTLVGDVKDRDFKELLVQLKVLAVLGYVDTARVATEFLPEDIRMAKRPNDAILKKLEALIKHATDSSQL